MSEKVMSEKAPAAIGPYSQAVIAGGMVYTSGQIAINPSSGEVEAVGIAEQTRQICRNLKAVLEAAGSSLDRAVKTTCYLSDMADFSEFNAVYAEYFTNKPARSCVAVKALPKGVLAEVDVIAEI